MGLQNWCIIRYTNSQSGNSCISTPSVLHGMLMRGKFQQVLTILRFITHAIGKCREYDFRLNCSIPDSQEIRPRILHKVLQLGQHLGMKLYISLIPRLPHTEPVNEPNYIPEPTANYSSCTTDLLAMDYLKKWKV